MQSRSARPNVPSLQSARRSARLARVQGCVLVPELDRVDEDLVRLGVRARVAVLRDDRALERPGEELVALAVEAVEIDALLRLGRRSLFRDLLEPLPELRVLVCTTTDRHRRPRDLPAAA